MPSPKSGTEVPPECPEDPHAADKADPGEMAEIKAEEKKKGEGKYGETKDKDKEKKKKEEEEKKKEEKKTWVQFKLIDADGQPVKGEKCKLILPDKSEKKVKTKSDGTVREEDLDPGGTVSIMLVDREDAEWKFLNVSEVN